MQRPHGLLLLVLRLPLWIYRFHLGWVLGNRFLLLCHVGRKSQQIHQSVIEVVKHDQQSDSFYVVAAWGENLTGIRIYTRIRMWLSMSAR